MVDTHKGHVRAFKNNPTITIDSVRHASDATRVAISHPRGQDYNCRESSLVRVLGALPAPPEICKDFGPRPRTWKYT